MTLRDIREAMRNCTGRDCTDCKTGSAKKWNCCIGLSGVDNLELTVFMPITKPMIDLGSEWLGMYILRTLNEAYREAVEEVRKTLCLPREGMKWNENKDRLCRYNSVIICDWPEDSPGRCQICECNPAADRAGA